MIADGLHRRLTAKLNLDFVLIIKQDNLILSWIYWLIYSFLKK